MSKPEVVGYASSEGLDAVRSESQAVFIYPTPVGFGEHASQALIRLTDHEAAMAELHDNYNDAAEDAMAIARRLRDTEAQRNELLGLLRDVREELAIDGTESWIRALMARIDATLANLEDNQC